MKRSFLRQLGVDKDLIDEILDENGKDIEAEKAKLVSIQEKLDEANQSIAELEKAQEGTIKQEELDDLQGKLKAEQEKVTALEKEKGDLATTYEKNHNIDLALLKAGAKNLKAVKALLDDSDLEEVVFEKGVSEKFDEVIKGLQESDSYLFGTGEDNNYSPKGGNGEPNEVSMHDAVAAGIKAQGYKV